MYTIHKQQIENTDGQVLQLPKDAKILTVQVQNEIPCLWYLHDNNDVKETRTFHLYGTGHDINNTFIDRLKYIGTYQIYGGSLVFHLFELLGS